MKSEGHVRSGCSIFEDCLHSVLGELLSYDLTYEKCNESPVSFNQLCAD